MTERGRFIRHTALVYGSAYLLGFTAMHLITFHVQGKTLITDRAAVLAGNVLATPILGCSRGGNTSAN